MQRIPEPFNAMCHFLATTMTRVLIAVVVLLTLSVASSLRARAQQQSHQHDRISATTSAPQPYERDAAERYTFDPETGEPRLTDEAAAAFFERHREDREAARPTGTLHPMRPSHAVPTSRSGNGFTVNSAGDGDDTNPGDGICFTGFVFAHNGFQQECTLRAAIEETNATPGQNPLQIDFDIVTGPAGSDLPDDVWRIRPQSALPLIACSNTTLDALTQPGASCGDLTSPNPGAPRHDLKVFLDGTDIPSAANGLSAPIYTNVVFRGFVVGNFPGYGLIMGSEGSVAECNYVGTDPAGEGEAANIGGVSLGSGIVTSTGGLVQNNLISGNDENGIVVSRDDAEVRDNLIGTNADGTQPNANGSFNAIDVAGINVSGDDVIIDGNVISGNHVRGIRLASSLTFSGTQSAERTQVTNNLIGLSRSGTNTGLNNARHGIHVIEGASDNDIGLPAQGNFVAGSGGGNWSGIVISGTTTDDNRVRGNTVGLDVNGQTVSNYQGIFSGDDSDGAPNGTTIGGPDAADGNIVGGNTRYGIYLLADTGGLVEGNIVGLNAANVARPNTEGGINIHGSEGSTVRGNTVSGNTGTGISMQAFSYTPTGPAQDVLIENNRIGTTPNGQTARPNGLSGIALLDAEDTTIRDNTIAANTDAGIYLNTDSAVSIDLFERNYIGTNPQGDVLGNGLAGVYCQRARAVQVGTVGDGNVIAYNGGDGVFVGANCDHIAVQGNIIHDNDGLGIDLAPEGVNPNDVGDGDTGANDKLNFPVITSAENDGTDVVIAWTLNARPNLNYQLLFCRNDTADPSGHGECETPNATQSVATNGAGNASGAKTLNASKYPVGSWVTVMATLLQTETDLTSEFAEAVQVEDTSVMQPDYELEATNTSSLTVTPGGQVSFDYSAINNTGAPVEGDLWFTIAPGGFSSVIVSGTVQAGQTVNGSFVQQVASDAPAGDYTYTLHLGQYPGASVDSEVFIVTVSNPLHESGSTIGSTHGSTAWSVLRATPWETSKPDTADVSAAQSGIQTETPTLSAAYPNPFSGRTMLGFSLPERDRVTLSVYDVLGREVARLVDGEHEAGQHEAVFAGSALASGVYVIQFVVGQRVQTQRLTLVR